MTENDSVNYKENAAITIRPGTTLYLGNLPDNDNQFTPIPVMVEAINSRSIHLFNFNKETFSSETLLQRPPHLTQRRLYRSMQEYNDLILIKNICIRLAHISKYQSINIEQAKKIADILNIQY